MKTLSGRTNILQMVAGLTMTILMSAGVAMAQTPETLVPGTTVRRDGGQAVVHDFVIPSGYFEGQLIATVRGADGGRRYYNDGMLINKHYAGGGGGAFLSAMFQVGLDGIPPGSTVRLIPGWRGESHNFAGNRSAAGGGGTGILFRAPGAGDDDCGDDDDDCDHGWQVVIAAGAGGGAYADCCRRQNAGKSASASDCNIEGPGGRSAGRAGLGFASQRGGGGGAYEDAVCEHTINGCTKVNGGRAGVPSGGEGGTEGRKGGWGFGGGGHSKGDREQGGGGGGYCGGDAGEYRAGYGGGSYVEANLLHPDFADDDNVDRINGRTTGKTVSHGFAEVTFLYTAGIDVRTEGNGWVEVYNEAGGLLETCEGSGACIVADAPEATLHLLAIPDTDNTFLEFDGPCDATGMDGDSGYCEITLKRGKILAVEALFSYFETAPLLYKVSDKSTIMTGTFNETPLFLGEEAKQTRLAWTTTPDGASVSVTASEAFAVLLGEGYKMELYIETLTASIDRWDNSGSVEGTGDFIDFFGDSRPDGAIPRRTRFDPETTDIEITFRVDWMGIGNTTDLTIVLELDDSW